jgi:hypothetical protein
MQSQNIKLANEVRMLENQKKKIEKEAQKQIKQAEKETLRQIRAVEKEAKQRLIQVKKEAKQRLIQTKRDTKKMLKENDKMRKETKRRVKQEITKISTACMILTAEEMSQTHPDGFTASELTNKYIAMHGNINPYTGESVDDNYDIHAAIRGFMYETSPSSTQHWFRYGIKKVKEQVAPWVFVNKELAIVNNSFDWKVSTNEMKKMQRQEKGKWKLLPRGSLAFYFWSDEMYGPMPTEQQLEAAKQGRKIGMRKGQQQETKVVVVDSE